MARRDWFKLLCAVVVGEGSSAGPSQAGAPNSASWPKLKGGVEVQSLEFPHWRCALLTPRGADPARSGPRAPGPQATVWGRHTTRSPRCLARVWWAGVPSVGLPGQQGGGGNSFSAPPQGEVLWNHSALCPFWGSPLRQEQTAAGRRRCGIALLLLFCFFREVTFKGSLGWNPTQVQSANCEQNDHRVCVCCGIILPKSTPPPPG